MDIFKRTEERLRGFVARHERFIFTTLARLLAVACMAVAAYYALKAAGQIAG